MKIELVCLQTRVVKKFKWEKFICLDKYSPHEQVDIFLDILKYGKMLNVRRVEIRTSQEHIPNFIGVLICQKLLNPEDFTVIAIDSDDKRTECGYDSSGYLINWVCGFFQPHYDDLEWKAKTFLKELK